MPDAKSQELCATLEALQAGATDQLTKLLGRFGALKRLADLLYDAGLDVPIPDPSQLIPVDLIDLDKYNQMASLCPGLLPPVNGNVLNDLRSAVQSAYLQLMQLVDVHPFTKLGLLQSQVDGLIDEAEAAFAKRIGPGIRAIDCAMAICGAVGQVGAYPPDVMAQVLANYQSGIGLGGGNATVLSPDQIKAASNAADSRQNIASLLSPTLGVSSTSAGFSVSVSSRPGTSTVLMQGPQGSQGVQGSKGDQGPQGFQGSKGNVGNQGPAGGPQGFQGVRGFQGTQGPQGTQGNQGYQGAGAQGAQGFQGTQGSSGGPQGFQGTQGSQGNQGIQGHQGFQGAQGNQGYQGITGFQGVQGTQGPAGGPQGFQGAQGVTGLTGSQGSQGTQGYQGVTGPQGAQGYQGVQGVQGFQGSQGNQGYQGYQGVQGTQGYQGNQGFQGNQGYQGLQGDQGAQGNQGTQGMYVRMQTIDVVYVSVSGSRGEEFTVDISGVAWATVPNGVGHMVSNYDTAVLYSWDATNSNWGSGNAYFDIFNYDGTDHGSGNAYRINAILVDPTTA